MAITTNNSTSVNPRGVARQRLYHALSVMLSPKVDTKATGPQRSPTPQDDFRPVQAAPPAFIFRKTLSRVKIFSMEITYNYLACLGA